MNDYNHLSEEERDRLAVYRSRGLTFREIGKCLDRDPGALCREFKRNRSHGIYLSHRAQGKAVTRRHVEHKHKRLKTYALRHDIEQMLIKGWSPEIIAGTLKDAAQGQTVVSHESIYQWIYAEEPHLIGCLVRARKKRMPRHYSKKHRSSHIPGRVSIDDRPDAVNKRMEAGHWEKDLMVSKSGKAALSVAVERKSRLARLGRIADKTAGSSRISLQGMLEAYPSVLRKSVTYDNGSENVEHLELNKILGTRSYFCNPYHSWEKGTVENTNGLIRRFFPKKTDFGKISDSQIKEIEDWLNNRPRKCLGFKTSAEIFSGFVALAP